MIERADVDDIAVVGLAHGKVNAMDVELLDAVTGVFTGLDDGPHAEGVARIRGCSATTG